MPDQSAELPASTTGPARWVFGEAPLPQTLELGPLLRRVAGLAMAMETPDPAVSQLIEDLRRAEQALAERGPADPLPRIGANPKPDRRVYLDHGFDIGAYNPCFPEYEFTTYGPQATGTVRFPLAFEGPPGVVHGGVIATFFDCVIQQHNCQCEQAGKTVTLQLRYRRPTPLAVTLSFEIDRRVDERITSTARLLHGDELLCTATVEAVAGERANLPPVSPRRWTP